MPTGATKGMKLVKGDRGQLGQTGCTCRGTVEELDAEMPP